jgi:DNA-binding NarL/FixJ family response regulator
MREEPALAWFPFVLEREVPVRSVLVCLRTPLAAQAVSSAASRLGLGEIISTAVSGADALARVAQSPPDVLLVDTASVRPDAVGFTRRVLERSPDATVVFSGPEESVVAERAVAAGARGLIRGGEKEDLVASVAKALMLLLRPVRATTSVPAVTVAQASGAPSGESDDPQSHSGVPLQRSDDPPRSDSADATPDEVAVPTADAGATLVPTLARITLTERELQVLRGMAEGKSNAEIGRELFVSEDTVKTHARRLFRKLGARDRAHAVAAAFRAGIVT